MKIYFNGSQVDDASWGPQAGSYVAMENLTNTVRIGKWTTDYGDGIIDEVAIFNTVLTADEIKQHYKMGRP